MTQPIPGGCYCHKIRCEVTLDNPNEQVPTSLCHIGNGKKFTGSKNSITTEIPKSSFKVTEDNDHITVHESDDGDGVILHPPLPKGEFFTGKEDS